jgi:ribosome-associated translation inhibitor RaiA
MTCATVDPALAIELGPVGAIDAGTREYVEHELARVAHDAPTPVRGARFVLHAQAGNGDNVAKARLDLTDASARAHVVGATAVEAIERATTRLRRQLMAMRELPFPAPARGRAGRWEFGREPTDRPSYLERPAAERELVRCKTWDTGRRTPEDAIRAAALLDYDFFMFVHVQTRRPTVVRRTDLRTWECVDAVRCTTADAMELLGVSGARFVFFIDGSDSNGPTLRALYRRYDGNYGLISPAG